MYKSLMAIKDKYENYLSQLSNAEIYNDIKKYNQINKEKTDIEDIYLTFQKYLASENSYNESKQIFETENDEELLKLAKDDITIQEETMQKIRLSGNSGFSTKPTNYYNLDVIISVGYRVKSLQ